MYDSSLKTGLVVHKADGKNHVLMPLKRGLCFSVDIEDIIDVSLNTADRIKNNTVKSYSDT